MFFHSELMKGRKPMNKDLKENVRPALIYTASTVLMRLGQVALMPLLWHKLTLGDFGVVGVFEIVIGVLGPVWGLSLPASVSRMYCEWPKNERKNRLGTIWVANWGSIIVLGVSSMLLLWLVAPYAFPNIPFYPYIALGASYGILTSMRELVVAALRIKQMAWAYFAFSLVAFLLIVASVVVFVLVLDWGLYGYLVALNATGAVMAVVCAVIMIRISRPCVDWASIKEACHFSLPLVPSTLIRSLMGVTDRILLQHFVSMEALGLYSLCVKFTAVVDVAHSALKMSFGPFIYRTLSENKVTAPMRIGRMRIFYMVPVLAVGIGVAIFVRVFVTLAGQPAYYPLVTYVPLFAGLTVIGALNAYFGTGLFLSKRTGLLWIPAVMQFAVLITANLFLIPPFQLIGVVISRYLAVIVFTSVVILLSEKQYPIPTSWTKVGCLMAVLGTVIVLTFLTGARSGTAGLVFDACLFSGSALALLLIALGRNGAAILMQPLSVWSDFRRSAH